MKRTVIFALFFLLATNGLGLAAVQDDKDFRAGLKHYNSKNYKAAVKQFREYLAKKPDPRGYYLAGYALYKLGKFSESEEYFREAFLIDPEFSLEKAGLMTKASEEGKIKEPAVSKKPANAPENKADQPGAKGAVRK